MAVIGAYGGVPFVVASDAVRTIEDAEWSGKARWAVHDRHIGHALTEFTGLEPDGFSFEMQLSAYLGINPMQSIVLMWKYLREGIPQPLVLGEKAYGKYMWSLTDMKIRLQNYDNNGNLIRATVSVTLQEYLNV